MKLSFQGNPCLVLSEANWLINILLHSKGGVAAKYDMPPPLRDQFPGYQARPQVRVVHAICVAYRPAR